MSNMFCFQCQQTAGNKGCVNTGVCGKQPETARLQDELIGELIRLATATHDAGKHSRLTDRLLMDGLFTTLTNVNFDDEAIRKFTDRVINERKKLRDEKIPVVALWDGSNDEVSLRSTLLFGLKGMAAYAHHAMNLGYEDESVTKWFYKGLCEVNKEHSAEEWIELIMEFGKVNFKCMELLDRANTETFGESTNRYQKRTFYRGFRSRSKRSVPASGTDKGQRDQHIYSQRNAARPWISGAE